ncbi:HD domain-containing protein (plasmid) [Aneurinibacillus sp. Ricciae_BoGa-3]|uniref:HD domain-containing protein n=1 Tax=Aneurinibacillus sp. Ricciae_BoGa-3 TaxID=3022697 RepID=UPI0023415D21|nr:HD domain-containing protein [Aneurinibacillus sp. Ricciae_BoGa-3]WCK57660.1 HD domain-containing protein [Aneurinibacillus sp. Ricciae_BoGa-3]
MIVDAIPFVFEKHKNQKRIGGEPYATHPIAVAMLLYEKGFRGNYSLVAMFHDLKEDTDATDEEILLHSNQEVLTAVNLLTKFKGYVMESYIEGIRKNKLAKMVKLADRLHNLLTAKIASESFRRKYIKETEAYYVELAKGTPFEMDIHVALDELKKTVA